MSEDIPTTRWELAGSRNAGYAERFTTMIDQGDDIDGEARLADVLAPRSATILDAGAGLGRVGAALQRRGHHVTAAEKDPDLVARAAHLFPDLPMIAADILELTPEFLRAHDAPTAYDEIVLVGNVVVLAAPETEVRLLRTLGALLAPEGRILVGFHPVHVHETARDYSFEEFAADAGEAGLEVEQHFGSYDLRPPSQEYVVAVLTASR